MVVVIRMTMSLMRERMVALGAPVTSIDEPAPALSDRERDRRAQAARGETRREIALVLSLSGRTVAGYLDGASRTLGVYGRAGAVVTATRLGPIAP